MRWRPTPPLLGVGRSVPTRYDSVARNICFFISNIQFACGDLADSAVLLDNKIISMGKCLHKDKFVLLYLSESYVDGQHTRNSSTAYTWVEPCIRAYTALQTINASCEK